MWLIGFSAMYALRDKKFALIAARIGFMGVIFIPIFIYHFYIIFLKLTRKIALPLIYIIGFLFLLLTPTPYIYQKIDTYFWGNYPRGGLIYPLYVLFFIGVFIRCLFLLFNAFRKERFPTIFREQIKYLFLAFLVATFGIVDYVAKFGIALYPFGYLAALGWIFIIAYTIVKHHLLEIHIAFTRVAIFTLVYFFIVFIPFFIAPRFISISLWWFPILLMGILATLAPFIYNYLRKQAENILLAEQKRYQRALREFAQTLIFIKDTESLAKEVTSKIIAYLNLDFCAFYLKQDKDFYLIHFSSKRMNKFPFQIKNNCKLVHLLNRSTSPILGESLPSLDDINVGLAFPLFLNKELFGFIVMSQKTKGTFTDTDIDVFTTISTQVSLALSQIYYFEEYQKLMDERYRLIVERERMESAFQISEAYRHELGNIINIISLSLANLEYQENFYPQKEDIEKVAHSIKKNVERARTIFDAIARYNKNARSKFKLMDLSKVVKDRVNQFSKNISKSNITIKSEIEEELRVWANDNLPDAIGYLIEGSIKAIEYHTPQNKSLYISLKRADNKAILRISDTGGDITENNLYRDMGIERGKEGGILYFIARRIIFDHKGSFNFQSFNQGEGTTFKIELPINEST